MVDLDCQSASKENPATATQDTLFVKALWSTLHVSWLAFGIVSRNGNGGTVVFFGKREILIYSEFKRKILMSVTLKI